MSTGILDTSATSHYEDSLIYEKDRAAMYTIAQFGLFKKLIVLHNNVLLKEYKKQIIFLTATFVLNGLIMGSEPDLLSEN